MHRALFVVAVAACGGGGTDSPVDGPPAGDAPIDTSAAQKQGILFIQETFVAANQLTSHVAEFRDGRLAATSRSDGACVITTGQAGTTPPKLSAGTITFTGATGGTVTTLSPTATGYSGHVDNSHLYVDNEQISIVATGAAVPAFTTSVGFPAAITVTDPTGNGGGALVKANGFSATWTGTSPVRILITQSGTGVQIQCTYSGVTTATVPASALADLVVGNTGTEMVSIVVAADTPGSITAGDFDIQLLVIDAGFAGVAAVQ